jgi:hypothetical protein
VDIVLNYDSSTSAAPTGFTAALDYAASELDSLITDNITVSISVSWDNSVLGEAGAYITDYSYATVVAAMKSHADNAIADEAVASLPATDPNRSGEIGLTDAQAEALGLQSPDENAAGGGYVTFGSDGVTLDFATTGSVPGTEYDFLGVALHELTHALGRIGADTGSARYIMDLYRYSNPGTLSRDGYDNTYFSINGGTTALDTFSTASDLSDWSTTAIDDSFDAYANPGVRNSLSSADDTLLTALGFDVLCFTAGTRIATPTGDIPVETLRIGDIVTTQFSGPQPIKWIGRSRYAARFLRNNHLHCPVYFAPDSIAPGIPSRPLTVSAGHGIRIGNALIPAWRLANGVSIRQDPPEGEIAYFHIELARHDVIFAESCPAETFLDLESRHQFHNAAEFRQLYPAPATVSPPCLPRLEDGFELDSIIRRLASRAGVPPATRPAGPIHGYIDVANPTRLAGWAQYRSDPDYPVTLDIFLNYRPHARILANRYRADLRDAGLGAGTSGFDLLLPAGTEIHALEIRHHESQTPLPFTAEALTRAA